MKIKSSIQTLASNLFSAKWISQGLSESKLTAGLQFAFFQSTTWGICPVLLKGLPSDLEWNVFKCKVKVKNPTIKKEYKVDFIIVGNHLTPLLSSVAAQKMDLISVLYDKFKAVIIQY